MTYAFLQSYWWVLIALLGGLLVALMFVQGANLHLGNRSLTDAQKRVILNATGRKWEITFTTLVTFGGAFFASFPLFYSTSFGGAYWVWILLLITFVFQAVSYEFCHKKENLLGVKGFRIALMVNGLLAPFLVGTVVGTFFTGSPFSIDKLAIADSASPFISVWSHPWKGMDVFFVPDPSGRRRAIMSPVVLLGLALMSLTSILGDLYILNNVDNENIQSHMRRSIKKLTPWFLLLFFLPWLGYLLLGQGYSVAYDGTVTLEKYKYLHNLLQMPVVLVMLLAGVVLVLLGIWKGGFTKSRKGFWFAAPGTVLVVMAVFFLAGFNGTAYYPSITDLQSSLTIRNSSSSYFTLKVMFWVSLLIPFVVAYIAYAWHQMEKKHLSDTDGGY